MRRTQKLNVPALVLFVLLLTFPVQVMASESAAERITEEAAIAAEADDSEEFSLFVNPYGNALDSADTITWFKQGNGYYLFLPSDCDVSDLTVYFTSDEPVTVNGKALVSGERTKAFSAKSGTV